MSPTTGRKRGRPRGTLTGQYGPRRRGPEVAALNVFVDALRAALQLEPLYLKGKTNV